MSSEYTSGINKLACREKARAFAHTNKFLWNFTFQKLWKLTLHFTHHFPAAKEVWRMGKVKKDKRQIRTHRDTLWNFISLKSQRIKQRKNNKSLIFSTTTKINSSVKSCWVPQLRVVTWRDTNHWKPRSFYKKKIKKKIIELTSTFSLTIDFPTDLENSGFIHSVSSQNDMRWRANLVAKFNRW